MFHILNYEGLHLSDVNFDHLLKEFNLKEEEGNKSKLKKSPLSDWSPACFEGGEILIFEGNIGVGKTSLAQKIAKQYQVPFLQENFKENPFFDKPSPWMFIPT